MANAAHGRGWLVLRLAILIAAMLQARSFVTSLDGDFSAANWATFFVLIAFGAFGVFFVIALQSVNPMAPHLWRRPSWFSSPFDFRQPLLVLDLGAHYFLILGLASMISGLMGSPKNWAWEIPLSVGIGAWIGVRMCLVAFRERFADHEQNRQVG